MVAFLSLVVVSRFGLYGFDLANLQLQQLHVDEAHRGAVGSVEEAMCSLGEASVYLGALVASNHGVANSSAFDVLVYLSAAFVGSGALVYTAWVVLYREREHSHHANRQHDEQHDHDSSHHDSTHAHDHPYVHHKHTTQQEASLKESTNHKHVHLHLVPLPCECVLAAPEAKKHLTAPSPDVTLQVTGGYDMRPNAAHEEAVTA